MDPQTPKISSPIFAEGYREGSRGCPKRILPLRSSGVILVDYIPVDTFQKVGNVVATISAVVLEKCVLVHVEREHWRRTPDRKGILRISNIVKERPALMIVR